MSNKPPPIQWLPAFESAAKQLSFRKAAEELCVSPPAISQQIKSLEEHLGIKLFIRNGRSLKLSAAGAYYYQVASKTLDEHRKGYYHFERTFKNPTLYVSAPIFVAQELLIPHYNDFKTYAPNTDLRLITGNEFVDFREENIDAAIRFGPGPWQDLECHLLQEVELKIVGSPKYFDQHRLSSEQQLSSKAFEEHCLISIYEDLRDWQTLASDLKPSKKLICDSYLSVIRAAEEGLGLAIALCPITQKRIDDGKLLSLHSPPLSTHYAYWLVSPKNHSQKKSIDALLRWLTSLFNK